MSEGVRYRAFISYSHADEKYGKWLHQKLERFRVPSRLVGRVTAQGAVPRRIGRCFRDQAELSAASHLSTTLQQALQESQCLIVICSRTSAKSRWVNDEIRYFRSLGRGDSIFALVIDGEPHAADPGQECFPPALLRTDAGAAVPEPLAADARDHADGMADAFLRLAAGLLGVGFDELRQRERQRRARFVAAIVALSALIASITSALTVLAYRARNDARHAQALADRRREQADDLLQFMLGDLRDKLEPIGKLSILDAVGKKALDYFAASDDDEDEPSQAARARALRQIADVRKREGDYVDAARPLVQAMAIDEKRVKRNARAIAPLLDRAEDESDLATLSYLKRELEEARRWFSRCQATTDLALRIDPGNLAARYKLVEDHFQLGSIEYQSGNLEEARQAFDAAQRQVRPLLEQAPNSAQYLDLQARISSGYWGIAFASHDMAAAVERGREYAGWRRKIVELAPDDVNALNLLTAASLTVLQPQTNVPVDDPALREACEVSEKLVQRDPDNLEYAENRMLALGYRVGALIAARRLDEGATENTSLIEYARGVYRRAPKAADPLRDLVWVMVNDVEIALLRRDVPGAHEKLHALDELTAAHDPGDPVAARWWALSSLLDLELADTASRPAKVAVAEHWKGEMEKHNAMSAKLMMRYEMLLGHRHEAEIWLKKMPAKDLSNPYNARFMRDHHLPGGFP